MKKINLSTNNKLALLALILGFVAIFFGNPDSSNKSIVNTEELALNIIDTNNIIHPMQLADWIIQGKVDYRLIDLRNESKYNEYAIPGAENIPLTQIKTSELLRNDKFIIYSDDELRTAQSWLLMKTLGYKNVYILVGGIDNWKESVIFPRLNIENSDSRIIEISKFFGGTPIFGNEHKESNISEFSSKVAPKIQAPSSAGGSKKPKQKREGC